MSDLVMFLLAEIAADEADPYCDGAGEYQRCAEQSDRRHLECEAKRRIVELHISRGFGWCEHYSPFDDNIDDLCPTLRLLAIPYADRPGFREEWRP
ncbi:DUF6221 family protein [Cellulomonas timonensis]|uniref:DUF6221 family protein n=1 Tax=Cellulomonas timonensis TaxID=1689271 RepID=UPI00082CB642|nr:DUF6221 family protein [Cellulomonas timonensis]